MPRPKSSHTGKVTEFRTALDYLRQNNPEKFGELIEKVKAIYKTTGSIKATAGQLGVGKRTLERAMGDIAELRSAIDGARAIMGR